MLANLRLELLHLVLVRDDHVQIFVELHAHTRHLDLPSLKLVLLVLNLLLQFVIFALLLIQLGFEKAYQFFLLVLTFLRVGITLLQLIVLFLHFF